MSTSLCLLILEDDPYDAELEIATLEESGYVCRWQRVETQAEFLARLGTSDYDLILADYSLPAFDGLTALKLVIERDLDLPFILVSGTLGEEVAIESLKAGATDYVLKDRLSRLGPAVRRALREKEEQRQRKRAAEALAEQERYFRTLLHILHEDFLVIDRDYRITDMTGTVLVTTGLTREEVVDRRCFEISHGYDDPCDELGEECLLPEVFETGEPRRCYHEHAHVDGSKSHVDIMLSPLKDEEGHVTHVIEAVRDITDLMLAQESLRESEERLSAFMDSAPDCFMLFDSELNFVDVNDATLEFFPTGTKKEDLIGKNILDVVPGLERTGRYDSYMEVIKTGKPFYVEDFVPHPKFGDRRLTVQAFKVDEGLGLIVTDITERKRTEEALRKSEKRYRSLFEGLPVGLYRMTPQGLILHANPALIQMLGYPDRRALMGVNALDLYVDAEDYERQQALLEREGLARDFEMQFRRYDGTVIWVRNTVQAVRSDRRDVFYHEGSMEDITERKRAEEALQALSSRYEAILAAAPDIIMEVDINKVYTWANNAGFEFFGEDVLGKEAAFYFEGEQDTYDTVQPLFNGAENVIYIESWQRRTDGEKRLLAWWCRGLKDANGDVTGTISTARDITERKRTEEERDRLLEQIRGQVQQVQQIMDTVPEGVLLLDADGQVILANPVAEGDLSVLAGAHVGDTLTRLGDRPLVELLTSPPKGLWHEVTTDSRRFEVIARSLEDGPEPEGWVLVIRDVTREREIQRHAQQRERLATVGQLAAGIAHDFNNIMATIVLYAQMLSQTEDLTPRGHERLATVNQQALYATNLTQQILDFSRRAVLERRPLNLLPLLKEQIKLLERTLPENIKIALAYGPDEYTVNADPTRVQQAVMNLALNARDAMPEGGNLRFGLERIQVQPGESPPLPEMEVGEWVQVTVADTGSGIPPDILPRVFDPFFTTKEPGKGSGLGLAQVHGIVKQHEGEIDVQSPSTGSGQVPSTEFIPSEAEGLRTGQVGQGTTFTIYLPALPVHPAEAPTLEIEALTKGEGETILVVEDNAPTRQALVESLELLNYRTLEASDGQEALAILERQTSEVSSPKVALVLSDVVMPGMGGVALFHALRQRNLAVKVVLLTGHPLEKDMERLRTQGLSDWLPKPPSLEQLAEVVARALES